MPSKTKKNKLKDYRKSVGYNQQELADASGVSKFSIGQIERGAQIPRGKTKIILFNTLVRLGAIRKDEKSLIIQDVFPM